MARGPEAPAAFCRAPRVRLTGGMTSLLAVPLVSPARKWTCPSSLYCHVCPAPQRPGFKGDSKGHARPGGSKARGTQPVTLKPHTARECRFFLVLVAGRHGDGFKPEGTCAPLLEPQVWACPQVCVGGRPGPQVWGCPKGCPQLLCRCFPPSTGTQLAGRVKRQGSLDSNTPNRSEGRTRRLLTKP